MKEFKRINRELSHKGSIVNFYTDTILLPDGRKAKWDHISHFGAAAVVAVDKDDKILLVRQYRNSLDRETIEIPAGGLENSEESTMECAARELEEETGFRAGHLEYLISVKTAVAFTNENIDIFIGKDLEESKQNLDPDEFISIERYELDTLIDKIYSGEIQDSKTVGGILAYAYKKKV